MEVLSRFLEQYIRDLDYYERASKVCAQICENELETAGIRAIVTYRAKRPDKLKEKLIKRNEKHKYKNIQEIYEDIVDLAGVRIAIYFPEDKEEVEKFIKSTFEVIEVKEFPQDQEPNGGSSIYKKVFSGYHATHYRVRLKPEHYGDGRKNHWDALIEIQIATVLMHAWAEVEHDLVYKPLSGKLSRDEYEILDELNGLILSGEIALKRLQKAFNERVSRQSTPFSNHFELAAFLYNRIQEVLGKEDDEITMGRVDILFNFLKLTNMAKPQCINKYIENIPRNSGNINIVQQLVELILKENPALLEDYQKSKDMTGQMRLEF
ncbi:MAG: RelA/SpoT domain-containing protein [Clostridiales bacterium]|nr:RelA/SpoT domain-containing protein [Clostridiales bacterium]